MLGTERCEVGTMTAMGRVADIELHIPDLPNSSNWFESCTVCDMKNLGLPETPSPFKPPSELIDERLKRAYEVWRELAGERFAPMRREIAPSRFKFVLSDMFLVEVIDSGADFRLALAGETVKRFLGSEFQVGKLLSQVSTSPFQERSILLFRRCVETKAPIALGPVRTLHDQRSYFDNEAVVLPLSDSGPTASGLMGVIHLSPARSAEAQG